MQSSDRPDTFSKLEVWTLLQSPLLHGERLEEPPGFDAFGKEKDDLIGFACNSL